jgi:hypothetical protein
MRRPYDQRWRRQSFLILPIMLIGAIANLLLLAFSVKRYFHATTQILAANQFTLSVYTIFLWNDLVPGAEPCDGNQRNSFSYSFQKSFDDVRDAARQNTEHAYAVSW